RSFALLALVTHLPASLLTAVSVDILVSTSGPARNFTLLIWRLIDLAPAVTSTGKTALGVPRPDSHDWSEYEQVVLIASRAADPILSISGSLFRHVSHSTAELTP